MVPWGWTAGASQPGNPEPGCIAPSRLWTRLLQKSGPEDAGCVRPARVPVENQVLLAQTARCHKKFPPMQYFFALQFGGTVLLRLVLRFPNATVQFRSTFRVLTRKRTQFKH